jgi:formylglycine-generating enzyme required for sulfatase activity
MTDMVLIPAGIATVGSDDGSEMEAPRREIRVAAFSMDVAPVTNAEFAEFVEATGYVTDAEKRKQAWGWKDGVFREYPGLSWKTYANRERANHPVVTVSWNDAAAYAAWRNKRLPTEFAWEAAACGGVEGQLYPWGNRVPDGSQCNWRRPPSDVPPTAPVDRYPPSTAGLLDLVGNVWQWCADELPSSGADVSIRARRGGAWNVIQNFRLRCSNRGALPLDRAAPNVGFRCASNA